MLRTDVTFVTEPPVTLSEYVIAVATDATTATSTMASARIMIFMGVRITPSLPVGLPHLATRRPVGATPRP